MKKFLLIILIMLLISFIFKPTFQANNIYNNKICLTISNSNDIVELSIEDYLKGVLLAEMSESFSLETLKAQAVVSRTYAIKKYNETNHICDNPAHCQAWIDSYNKSCQKISLAINETANEILTYSGEPINAFFHSASGGKTENVQDVWSSSIPYLISVDSPNEEKIMQNFNSSLKISYKEFAKKINNYEKNKSISEKGLKNGIKILSRTDGNHVKAMQIQNSVLYGTEIRNIFNLRSTNFNIKLHDNEIEFNVTGYGHGVGMSQYGAEAMAQNGSTYQEILEHYYPGTKIGE